MRSKLKGNYLTTKIPRSLRSIHDLQNAIGCVSEENISEISEMILKTDFFINQDKIRMLVHEFLRYPALFTTSNDSVIHVLSIIFNNLKLKEIFPVFKEEFIEQICKPESNCFSQVYKVMVARKMYLSNLFSFKEISQMFDLIIKTKNPDEYKVLFFLAFANDFCKHEPNLFRSFLAASVKRSTLSENLMSLIKRMPEFLSTDFEKLRIMFLFGMETKSLAYAIYIDDAELLKNYIEKDNELLKKRIWFSPIDPEITPDWSIITICALYGSNKCFEYLCEKTDNKILDDLDYNYVVFGCSEEIKAKITDVKGKDALSACVIDISKFRNDSMISEYTQTMEYSQNDINKSLLLAVYNNNVILMCYLLENGADINYRDPLSGDSPFSIACRENHYGIINYFVTQRKYKIDFNSKDSNGMTPLIRAVKDMNSRVLRILLSVNDVDVNARDNNGWTALLHCIKAKDSFEAEMLLEKEDINPNLKATDGNFPLRQAVINHDDESTAMLVNHPKIDINNRDGDESTVLFQAVCHNLPNYINLFLKVKGVDPNLKGKNGFTPLSVAAMSGQFECLRELLACEKTDINQKDGSGNTALISACSKQSIDMVKELLAVKGVNVNARGYLGNTALITAVILGNLQLVKLLTNTEGVNINLRNDQWNTPLQVACLNKKTEIVKYLLTLKDVAVNSFNKRNETAITISVRQNDPNTLHLLLMNKEVDANVSTDDVPTPLAIAAEKNFVDVAIELISSPKVDVNMPSPPESLSPIFIACSNGNPDIVKVILSSRRIRSDLYPDSHVKYLFDAADGNKEVIAALEMFGLRP